MRRSISLGVGAALMLATAGLVTSLPDPHPASASPSSFEVWAIDQSSTRDEDGDGTLDSGGTLYVYDGPSLAGRGRAASAIPEVVDLGEEARDLCVEETGAFPVRPHMLLLNASHSHAIVSFVATGHVLFLDAATRTPLACIDVGLQAHAAFPAPDETYVVVANQNGKLLQRISTDYETDTFVLDAAATLDLATCTTPSGAPCEDTELRPDNAPICPIIDATSTFTFVTLRGGGLLVVDTTVTPMAIVAEYDRDAVQPNGCGGVEAAGKMYINSGGGTGANPLGANLYAFPMDAFSTTPNPPNVPEPTLVFSHDDRGFVDSHGAVLTRHDRFLWVADRAANLIVIVDTSTDEVVNEIRLAGPVSDDPAPDLLDVSPAGNRVFASLRGPNPLTANVPGVDNAVGSTPGVGVIQVRQGGLDGVLVAVAPISQLVEGIERADPHALRVRWK